VSDEDLQGPNSICASPTMYRPCPAHGSYTASLYWTKATWWGAIAAKEPDGCWLKKDQLEAVRIDCQPSYFTTVGCNDWWSLFGCGVTVTYLEQSAWRRCVCSAQSLQYFNRLL